MISDGPGGAKPGQPPQKRSAPLRHAGPSLSRPVRPAPNGRSSVDRDASTARTDPPPDCGKSASANGSRTDPPVPSATAKDTAAEIHYEEFDERVYLYLNPDVADAIKEGIFESGHDHWIKYGRIEYARRDRPTLLRLPHLAATAERTTETDDANVDASSYLYLNPDVRRAVSGNYDAARDHWSRHGKFEGRARAGRAPFANRHVSPADVLARPYGINVFGPLSAESGLGTVARAMVRAIGRSGIPFELWNYDTSHGAPMIAERDRTRPPPFRINLILANADTLETIWGLFPDGFFNSAYNIGVWQWELAAFRPDWFTSFGALDEVWTNSEFQRAAIAASAPVPVLTIRPPVEPSVPPRALDRKAFGIPEDRYAFLCAFDVGSSTARKNPLAAVRAFKAAFGERDDATLVLKFHSAHQEREFIPELARATRGVRNIVVIAQKLTHAEMADLRDSCDCLVSPHRSEGFGLNIAEFMALGKPVIATDYSGNRDFVTNETGFPVEYGLAEITKSAGPYWAGFIWAEPRDSSLSAQMIAVIDDREGTAARCRRAAELIATDYSCDAVAASITARFHAIGLDAQPVPFVSWVGMSPSRAVILPETYESASRGADVPAVVLSIVVPVFNVPGDLLERCIASVIEQSYSVWELCICNDASTRPDTLAVLARYRGTTPKIRVRDLPTNVGIAAASNAAAEMASGDYLVMLDNDDELAPGALLRLAHAIDADPQLDCLYSDEEKIDIDGRRIDHFLKPDWSPEHLESVMYMLHMFVVRKRLFLDLGGFRSEFTGAQDYDLALRCSRASHRIGHLSEILYRWRALPGSAAEVVNAKPYALTAGMRALAEHARLKYGEGTAVEQGLTEGTFRVRRAVPLGLRATLLILTNNTAADIPGRGTVNFVENFVDSILARTDHRDYEIVVVDNSALSSEQVDRLRARGVRVENYVSKTATFNFSAKANFAIGCSQTEHVVLLNDDMEVIAPGWLTALLELSQDLEIGAVGARLKHFDGTLQHAGMVLGINESVAHVYHGFSGDMVGYNGFTHIIRNYSVVTGACLAAKRSALSMVGGFDENFAVDFNDVDLCLRLAQAGFRNVYTPFAELYHFEQASLPRHTQDAAERDLFRSRWGHLIDNDPFYNQHLARDRLDFALRDEGRA